jgi:mono/diheme cytochrome c family protein
MKKITAVFTIFIFTLIACKSTKTAVQVQTTSSTQYLATGKAIYTIKCATCHDLPKVEDFTAQKWTGIVDWMAPKARLNKEEKAMVLEYVHAMAKK